MKTWLLILGLTVTMTSARGQGVFDEVVFAKFELYMDAIYGRQRAFSAQAEIRKGQELNLTALLAIADGKIRTELELERISGRGLPPEEAAQLKQVGLDRLVEIERLDTNVTYVILPTRKSFCETRPDNGPAKPFKMEKHPTGKGEWDKHPCLTYSLTLTDADGEKMEAAVWEATDLDNLPVKMEFSGANDEEKFTVALRNVNRGKPDSWLFDPPPGFRRYQGVDQMLEDVMRQMMPNF